jgi:Mlc titration factor MtfA (ptsG expression regulator)
MKNKELKSKVIKLLRKELKKQPMAKHLCKKYNEDLDFIDSLIIRFEPIDVSAKTVNGEIVLNSHLLESKFRDNMRYLIHEFTHALQQENGMVDQTGDKDYLDDPNEVEAFRTQLDYMEETYNEKEIQEYLEQLLDHHKIKGKDRIRKIKELM